MSRLARFEHFRFVGVRDTMLVYDCDDDAQFDVIQNRVESEGLVGQNLLQAFAPDTELEARNRGYTPVEPSEPKSEG